MFKANSISKKESYVPGLAKARLVKALRNTQSNKKRKPANASMGKRPQSKSSLRSLAHQDVPKATDTLAEIQ